MFSDIIDKIYFHSYSFQGNAQFAAVPRHRSISGNSLSSPMQQAGNHFHFPPDSQFPSSQAQMSVYSSQSQQQQQQQQQQMYAQNRIIHRQLSLPPGISSVLSFFMYPMIFNFAFVIEFFLFQMLSNLPIHLNILYCKQ